MRGLFAIVRRQAFGLTIIACVTLAFVRPTWFLDWGSVHLLDWVGPMIQLIMFGMGTTLGLKDFAQILKAPWAVAIGGVLQFTVKPLVGLAIARVLGFDGELAAGVILVGSVAGGAASNVIAYLARANVALSVTMTCCSTVLCPFVTPFLMKWLAGQYVAVDTVPMMIAMFKIVLLPVVGGSVVHALLREQFERHKRVFDFALSLVSMFGICFSLVVILAPSRERLIEAGLVLLLASAAHNLTGYVAGYWISRLAGRFLPIDERDCRTVAIEVGLQNGAMASALAIDVLKSPVAALPPNVFSIWMNFSGSILADYWNRRPVRPLTNEGGKRWTKR